VTARRREESRRKVLMAETVIVQKLDNRVVINAVGLSLLAPSLTNATDAIHRIGKADTSVSVGVASNLYVPPRMVGISLK
jgi:hypothetical protein